MNDDNGDNLDKLDKIVTEPNTRLSGKEFSPMILRRYSMPFLHWVAIISDDNLDELDKIALAFWRDQDRSWEGASIQDMRNLCGDLSRRVSMQFPKLEGCAVIFSADKMLVSSLTGDFMVHEQCRLELYSLLNLSTQV